MNREQAKRQRETAKALREYGDYITGKEKQVANSSTANNSGGGIGLGGAVFIVFLVLKLTHNIDWSWWWVTSPLWIPVALVLVFLIIGGLGALAFGRK